MRPYFKADIDSPRGEKMWGSRVAWDPLFQFSRLWGCPEEVIYVGASFVRASRARAPRTAPFLGLNVRSAPREVVSLVVTPSVRACTPFTLLHLLHHRGLLCSYAQRREVAF